MTVYVPGSGTSAKKRIRAKLTWSPFTTAPLAKAASMAATYRQADPGPAGRPFSRIPSATNQNDSSGKLPGNAIGRAGSKSGVGRRTHISPPAAAGSGDTAVERHSSSAFPCVSWYQRGKLPKAVVYGPGPPR